MQYVHQYTQITRSDGKVINEKEVLLPVNDVRRMYPDAIRVAHCTHNKKKRPEWVRRTIWAKSLLMLALLIIGCNSPTSSKDPGPAPGEYLGILDPLAARLVLRIDGTYTHTLTHQGQPQFTESGTWEYEAANSRLCLTSPDGQECAPIWDVSESGFTTPIDDPEVVQITGKTQVRWVRQ